MSSTSRDLVVPGRPTTSAPTGSATRSACGSAGGTAKPRVERYLFAVLQRGLRSVGLQSSPTFRSTFTKADIPGVEVHGVRFTGYGYEETSGSQRLVPHQGPAPGRPGHRGSLALRARRHGQP